MPKKGDIWELADIMKGETYESLLIKIENSVKKIEALRPKLNPSLSPSEMLDIILLFEQTDLYFSKLGAFYALKSAENTKDEEALAKMSALSMKGSDFETRSMFFQLWFIGLSDEDAARYIKSKELSKYSYYLQSMRLLKPYTRSEEVEQVLAVKDVTGGEAFANLYEIHTSEYKFAFNGEKDLTQDQVAAYFMSSDPKMREKSYELVYSKYKEDSVFLSEIYKNIVLDWSNESVKIRKYAKPISARNIGNRIDDKSVDAFLRVVRKNTGIFVEYYRLKNEILNRAKPGGKSKDAKKTGSAVPFSRYHIYAPLNLKESKYSYEDAKKIVFSVYKKFDERFYAAAKRMFEEKHIHSHPQAGKTGGAFCSMVNNATLPYVLLNHSDKLNDVFTMAHELGHAIHDQFSSKQIEFLSHAKLPLAETASIFGETLLLNKFLDESKSKEEKIALLAQFMDSHYRSIPRQAYFVLFENWAHEKIKEGVTKKEMDDYYYSLLREQFGDMEIPEVFSHEWNYIPHIHKWPFYTYAYAWGHLLSLSLYAMYKEQGKRFIDKYVEFLSAGSSAPTTDIMLAIGADPRSEAFWQKGFDIIRGQLEELKKLTSEK